MVVKSGDSVQVSWNSIDFPEITGYVVYYSQLGRNKTVNEQSVHVRNSSASMVAIKNLVSGGMYQFIVLARSLLDDAVVSGPRSMPILIEVVITPVTEGMIIIILALYV